MKKLLGKFFYKPVGIPKDYSFQDKSSVYLFSNENIAGYLNAVDVNGANVLAVGASGDHAFEAYLAGASHVDTFDINSWQKPVIELKTHMIRNLDYEKFRDFFFNPNYFFDLQMLNGIRSSFSPELKVFLQQCQNQGNKIFKYRGAQHAHYDTCVVSYLRDSAQYEKLSKILPEKIPFRHCNLADLSHQTSVRYDFMMLSNIFEYMYQNSGIPDFEGRLMAFYKDILCGLEQKNLTPDGKMCFHYIWGGQPSAWASFMGYFEDNTFYEETGTSKVRFNSLTVPAATKSDVWDIALFLSKKTR